MLLTNGVTLRFGKRVLFEDVSIKFTKGNCYGIIGANGAGKSTFLKILSGEIEPNKGEVVLDKGERLSVLKQDHYAFEEYTVLDTVMMGNEELYRIMKEKEAIYAKPDFSEEDGMKAAKLEEKFAELDGWNAESDAAILLNDLGIDTDKHYKLMSEIDPKEKVKIKILKVNKNFAFGKTSCSSIIWKSRCSSSRRANKRLRLKNNQLASRFSN